VKQHQDVDAYLRDSGRWRDEIEALRPILLECPVSEEIKWGKPCYTHDGKNILILQEMKDFLAVMFFKGALLGDDHGVLVDQGPNSRSARRIQITSVDDVHRLADTVAAYVDEAIAVEEAGLQVEVADAPALADALEARCSQDQAFKAAFDGLTPGRQREYNLYVSQAKQATTRAARVERCADKILAGKGLRDR
jgi:uncharacterized protein YdeI (YjbR/CyaY-like superfamily)